MGLLDFFKKEDKGKGQEEVTAVLPEQIYQSGVLELKDVIAPSALQITPKNIHLGQKMTRTLFVMSYPRYLTESWFSPIINLDKPFDISIFIHPVDTAEALKKFEKKVAEIKSQIAMREKKGMVRDPKLDTAYSDLDDLRNKLQQAQEHLFEVGLYVTIYGDNKKELDKVESEIKSLMETNLVYLKPALFQQEQGFKSILPIAEDKLGVHSKLNSSPLSSLFPFISFNLTADKGILYGINRHNSSLILFDRFSFANYNSVMFATSGAGKSYASKLEIVRSLMFGADVIVIDPEREYEYLASATGGRFFNISLSSEHNINPFDLPAIQEDESPEEVLRSNVINLVGLFRIMLGGLTPEEDTVIDKAITQTYALKDITGDKDFSNMEPPLMSDFQMVLTGMEGSESLVQRISKYTEGTFAGFINRPTNVDLNKQFVVFSMRDMEDSLKPTAMYLVTHHIWNMVRKNLKKRLMVIDEAWWMMKSKDTASFLFGLSKRGRKYYLGIATITQDVEDFLKSEYGKPILTNSSLQMLLRQSPTVIDKIQETFNLSDEEKYLLLESDVGEGIFFAGLKHAAIRIVASYTEDQIITSDPEEVLAMQEEKKEKQLGTDSLSEGEEE